MKITCRSNTSKTVAAKHLNIYWLNFANWIPSSTSLNNEKQGMKPNYTVSKK